jgi:class 3 adenylate cyclase
MRCPSCGRENRKSARFCLGCGGALSRPCPACGTALPADAAFCDACGEALSDRPTPAAAAPEGLGGAPQSAPDDRDPRAYTPKHLAERILTSRSALEGERKNVTVLFADVAGFTPLAEGRDPEEVHAWMDRFFQIVLDEVHRYEGTVNQFLGDGAMALFGAPLALEDAPLRAVRAALGIQRRLLELREEARVDLPLRIGIHCGPVVVGRIGDDLRMDYTAVGDTTNLAARLQQLAEPGSVLVSDAARRQLVGYFELADLGERAVRGKSGPVHAWRVLAQRPVSGRIDAVADVGLTPLVGRERELGALAAAFESARDGRGQVCFLVGEAGIGKSRLLFEFRQRLGGEPHTWFEGRCASYGASAAFQALVDGLQRFFGIDDRDSETTASAKVERGVAAQGDGLGWTLPLLRALVGLRVWTSRPSPPSTPSRAAARRSAPSTPCSWARPSASPWCSWSRTCTGSTPPRRSSSSS